MHNGNLRYESSQWPGRFYVCYLLRPLLRISVRRGMPNEELNVTMCWLRMKIGFLCQKGCSIKNLLNQKSALPLPWFMSESQGHPPHGTRTPSTWYKETPVTVFEDFRLTVHEADLYRSDDGSRWWPVKKTCGEDVVDKTWLTVWEFNYIYFHMYM